MRRNYLLLASVFVASVMAWLLLPEASFLREVSSVPLVGSLVLGLFQIALDNAHHQREVGLKGIEQSFVVGATSHMANVAFDKHAEFCEKYIAAVFETLNVLFRKGPTSDALEEGWKLTKLRRDYAAWLSDSLELRLIKSEDALKEMGAAGHVLEMTDANIDRQPHIKTMYRKFAEVMGRDYNIYEDEPLAKDVTIDSVLRAIREILGVEKLTILRQAILDKARGA